MVSFLRETSRIMDFIVWENKYLVGIDQIDTQHKQLFDLTNKLYDACLLGDKELQEIFKTAMGHMVEYVHFHFSAEMEFLRKIKYPDIHNHKLQHDELIKNILSAANDFKEGKTFVPNHFVRMLKDWIISHIAVYDKEYALYVKDQVRIGNMDEDILHKI